ncbi:hypothetical protein BS297_07015 [Rhodococcus erythropolis]|uniref:Uncharacterized protein n=1 Tax=Rhodococcus erythropolis TaxID=1833 RepID=A0A5N5E6S0_RHOER|nr:hypothetical protein BS297_07015 [Rhodococcus erythropolis]
MEAKMTSTNWNASSTRISPAAYAADKLAQGTSASHLRICQRSGNVTIALIAGMLHEITERHTSAVTAEQSRTTKAGYTGAPS